MFPLYKGGTRPATFLGVPRIPMIATLMLCAALWLIIHLWALPIFAFLWFVEFCICKHDARMFRIMALWFRTKGLNKFRTAFSHRRFNRGESKSPAEIWGGTSYAPMTNVREDR